MIDQTKRTENETGTWGPQLVGSSLYDGRAWSGKDVARHAATGLHNIRAFRNETYGLEAERRILTIVGNLEDCDRGAR